MGLEVKLDGLINMEKFQKEMEMRCKEVINENKGYLYGSEIRRILEGQLLRLEEQSKGQITSDQLCRLTELMLRTQEIIRSIPPHS